MNRYPVTPPPPRPPELTWKDIAWTVLVTLAVCAASWVIAWTVTWVVLLVH